MAKKYMSENDYKNADYTNGYAKNEADKATDKGQNKAQNKSQNKNSTNYSENCGNTGRSLFHHYFETNKATRSAAIDIKLLKKGI